MFLRNILSKPIFLALFLSACGDGGGNTPTETGAVVLSRSTFSPTMTNAESEKRTSDLTTKNSPASAPASQAKTLAVGTTAVLAGSETHKAMWSWRDSDITNIAAQRKLIDFAIDNKITALFVSAQWLIRDYPTQFAQFIDLAASKGIGIELLLGDHQWALAANHQLAVDQVYKANEFVRNLRVSKPTALHFDVEPHSLPDWGKNQVNYGNQLIDLYVKLARVKEPGLAINADIAMGYRFINIARGGVTKTLSQWLIDKTDRTTVMAYRDYAEGADSIIEHVGAPIAYALRHGKVSYVGIETTCGLVPEKITFCEENRAGLNEEIKKVTARFSGNEGFGGMAIHDFAGYSVLP